MLQCIKITHHLEELLKNTGKYFEPFFFNFKVFKACNNSILPRNGKELFINLIKK